MGAAIRVSSSDAHIVLRERTRQAHEAAEAADIMHRLMGDGIDDGEYTALLAAQLTLFREWESEHHEWLHGAVADAGWSFVSRVALLHGDLAPVRDGGLAPVGAHAVRDSFSRQPPGTEAKNCRAQRALLHEGDACRWGMLYVVEGSALGGRVIARRLRERFPDRSHGFYAIGETTPPWRRFQSILDTALPGDAAQAAAVDGAQRMFARFQSTLQDPAPHV